MPLGRGRDEPAAGGVVRTGLFAFRLIWGADPWRFAGVVLVQLTTAIGLAGAVLLVKGLLGAALGGGATLSSAGSAVLPGLLVVLGAQALGSMLRTVSQGWQRVLAVKTDRHIIAMVLRSAAGADLAAFDDATFYDRLQRAIFTSRNNPVTLVTGLSMLLRAGLGMIAVGASFLAMVWWLLPLCLIALLPVLVAARAERNARYRLHGRLAENRRGREYLERLLTGRDEAKEIRAVNLGPTLRERWDRGYQEEIALTTQLHRRHTGRGVVARLISDGITAAIVGGLWLLVNGGQLDLPTAMAVLTALLLLSTRMQATGFLASSLSDTLLYLRDMRAFVDADDEPAAPAVAGRAAFSALVADRIGFRYRGASRAALREVSLTMRQGEIVALVGPNGSGKTTLAKILAGLYRPTGGQLLRDGVPVDDQRGLRDSAAVVFQDFIRYKLPAVDAIAFGRPDAPVDREAVRHAALRAGVDRIIEGLPAGYDTRLSQEFTGGTDLSLGQWQRLALARAFYRDAPYVILDEPAASLDAQAEADLFDRIRELFAGRTVLLISHRFSNVRMADHIYVLDRGRIVEHGTHDSLLAADAMYARLYQLQASAYQPQPTPAPR